MKSDKEEHEEQEASRLRSRKPKDPKAGARNFQEENARMGVKNELDLLIGEAPEKIALAKGKQERGLLEFSSQNAASQQEVEAGASSSKKKERTERYLTV